MANKIREASISFKSPALPTSPLEYSKQIADQTNNALRLYFNNVDEALRLALSIDTSDIVDGSIPNSKLENSTVSYGGITLSLGESDATPAFNLSDATNYPAANLTGTISTAQIADDAVTDAKLANSINSAIAANTAKVTNATHTGEVTGATALTIADGAVVTARIADDAVTDAKLANSINSAIAANTAKVTNATHSGEVTGATALTIADGAVVTARIADDAVTTAKIADDAVDTAQIADDAITTAQIAASAVSFGQLNTSSVTGAAIQTSAVTTTKIADANVTTAKIADDAVTSAKITGPFSSKHGFSTNFSQVVNTTAAVTVFTFSIPAPAGGVEATQSLSASIMVRFQNTSSSADKKSHQWKVLTQMKSKSTNGTSLGTATFVSSPSTYNAFYTVSGDKTSILCSNRGNFATSITGANTGSLVAFYYESASDKTFFRVSKFPDANTVYNGVEVFYSPTAFTSAGTYVSNQGFNNQFLTIGTTTAYQTIELPLMATFGRSTTATDLRIQFDHVSGITNLYTAVSGVYGHVENTV